WAFGEDSSGSPNVWKAPASAASVRNPVAADKSSIERGQTTYRKECASCHGEGGKGDGADAKSLKTKPANLTDADVTAESDGELYWKISEGRKPMPKFGKRLSENDRWDVVNYVRSLSSGRR